MESCRHACVLAGGTVGAAPHVLALKGMGEMQRAVQSLAENQLLLIRRRYFSFRCKMVGSFGKIALEAQT